ncbi:ABC transporter permease subunit [Pyrococcus sp. ST04]|uniref:ABC transporter permease subunit n=1 Tax=Pyrococcus sp. ST04 TaxID=1183377 RepID=UPI0002605B54|nr:ABC transporter permease subunit [Pyrococcus sp. ST04]AFK22251.1 hypothetical protein Py04_0649 [Pyrococcus sp. ST04]
MNDLWVVFVKELKNIFRDRKMLTAIITPLVIIPIVLGGIQASNTPQVSAHVIDQDQGKYSRMLIEFLQRNGVLINESSSITLIIPQGFSKALEEGSLSSIILRVELSSVFDVKTAKAGEYVGQLCKRFVESLIPAPKPQFQTVFMNKTMDVAPSLYLYSLLKSALIIPTFFFLIAIYASQVIAATIAVEKEQKTLETLLTLPVSRRSLILGKIFAAVAFSILVMLSLGVSFGIASRFSSKSSPSTMSIGALPIGVLSLCVFMLSMLMLLTSVIVSLFTQDVRSALSIAGLVELPYLIPLLTIMGGFKISDLYRLVLVTLNPGYAPFYAFSSALNGEYLHAVLALLYLLAWNALVLKIAVWAFNSDFILTANLNTEKLRWLIRIKI